MRRTTMTMLLAAGLLAGTGCMESVKRDERRAESLQALGPDGKPLMTESEVSSLVRGFADRYVEVTAQALDEILNKGPTPQARSLAQARKALGAASVFAIAARPNAEVALLDMAAQITLEREVWTRGFAEEVFGPSAAILTTVYDALDADIWRLAARVFTQAQLDSLRDAIEQWLVDNPKQRYLAFIQVEEFARLRAGSPLEGVGRPGGRSMLAPINDATRAADEIRLLGERALYITQRLPRLAECQAELFVYELLEEPEVQSAVSSLKSLSPSVDSLHQSITDLPGVIATARVDAVEAVRDVIASEREKTLDAIDARTKDLSSALGRIDESLSKASGLAGAAGGAAADARSALETAQKILDRLDEPTAAGPDAAPRLERLSEAAERLASASHDLNAALGALDSMLASPNFGGRMNDLSRVAADRINHIGLWCLAVVVAFFAGLIAVRKIAPGKPSAARSP